MLDSRCDHGDRHGNQAHANQHQPARLQHPGCEHAGEPGVRAGLKTARDNPAQHISITVGNRCEQALHRAVKQVGFGVVAQKLCAHHGCQRQSDKTRHHHRACQGQGEFNEQAAGAPGREGQWRINGHQSRRHGDDRKPDFTGTLDTGRKRVHAFFNVPENIFQHDNRIIHHQADGQHQGQQGERIDGKTGQRHQRESTHQTDRNGDDRNDGGAQRTQKHEDDQGHQQHSLQNRDVNILNGAVNEGRVVIGHVNQHVAGQISFELGDGLTHTPRQVQRIGCRLTNHAHSHG